jgi:hypothetical protein
MISFRAFMVPLDQLGVNSVHHERKGGTSMLTDQ